MDAGADLGISAKLSASRQSSAHVLMYTGAGEARALPHGFRSLERPERTGDPALKLLLCGTKVELVL